MGGSRNNRRCTRTLRHKTNTRTDIIERTRYPMAAVAAFPTTDGGCAGRWAPTGRGDGTHVLKMKFGYWAIRGLAAPIRMMCEYAGAAYEEVQYGGMEWFQKDKAEILK